MLTLDKTPALDLSIEELENLEAPGWGFWAGVAAGVVTVGAAVGVGVLIAT